MKVTRLPPAVEGHHLRRRQMLRGEDEAKRGPNPFTNGKGGKRSSLRSDRRRVHHHHAGQSRRDGRTDQPPRRHVAPLHMRAARQVRGSGAHVRSQVRRATALGLSDEGRRIAELGAVMLDEFDRDLMEIVPRPTPMTTPMLAAHAGTNVPRALHRLKRLAEQEVVWRDQKDRWRATAAGLKALGEPPPPAPARWLILAAISAAEARDVLDRRTAGMTRAERSRHGRAARMRMEASQRGHPWSAAAE
jgi:hypothetical protein